MPSDVIRKSRSLINLANILFVLLVITELIPSKRSIAGTGYTIGLFILIQLIYIAFVVFGKRRQKVQTYSDVVGIIYILLLSWELLTAKFNLLDKSLYPAPEEVIRLFIHDLPELLKGLVSSFRLLFLGYLLALLLAIPSALILGWRKRLYYAANPFTKVLGPIPPTVYIPYAIAILPAFMASSVFVIFVGAFWPIFINTLNGVFNIEKKIIDSARALNVNERTMLLEIILPGALPSVFTGATIGLVFSFVLLTSAELIGATSGMGWYVKYFSDFADYHRVIVGIVFIGLVVTFVTYFYEKLENHLLRWRR
ncbi:MAG TPA: ABC transporter permease subunit [Bacillota bacterium]|nr:ABC transporter permease subunit [Bacillota bacterium]